MITRERTRELRAVIEGAVSAYDMEDSEALKVVELFPTWETLLAAGNALAENTILNDGGVLYRVVQTGGVVPQEHTLAVGRLVLLRNDPAPRRGYARGVPAYRPDPRRDGRRPHSVCVRHGYGKGQVLQL